MLSEQNTFKLFIIIKALLICYKTALYLYNNYRAHLSHIGEHLLFGKQYNDIMLVFDITLPAELTEYFLDRFLYHKAWVNKQKLPKAERLYLGI